MKQGCAQLDHSEQDSAIRQRAQPGRYTAVTIAHTTQAGGRGRRHKTTIMVTVERNKAPATITGRVSYQFPGGKHSSNDSGSASATDVAL